MKGKTVLMSFLIMILAVVVALGQGPPAASGGQGSHYDKATEMTVRGTVESVTPRTTEKNRWAQVRFKLKSGSEAYQVHVGPSAYLWSQHFSLAERDTLEVVGSKVKIQGLDVLLARQITKNGKVLKLRNEEGFPVFAHRERQSSHTHNE